MSWKLSPPPPLRLDWRDNVGRRAPECPRDTPCRRGHRSDRLGPLSLWHAVPSAVSQLGVELLDSRQSPAVTTFDTSFEPRPLPSPGITRLQRYYEPFRHPDRPGLTLTGCALTCTGHRSGFPVLHWFPLLACRRPYPGRTAASRPFSKMHRHWPSPCEWRFGSCDLHFRGLLGVYINYGPHSR